MKTNSAVCPASLPPKNREVLALWQELVPYLRLYALKLCGSLAGADDLLAEAHLRISVGRRRCRSLDCDPIAFACGVIKSLASHTKDCRRTRIERPSLPSDDAPMSSSASPERKLDAAREAAARDDKITIASAVFEPGSLEQRVFCLSLRENIDDRDELAARLGVSPKAVADARSRIARRAAAAGAEADLARRPPRRPSPRRRPTPRRSRWRARSRSRSKVEHGRVARETSEWTHDAVRPVR